jgi:hypothetical protein
MRYKLIACEIVARELYRLASECPHTVDVMPLPKGLHDLETEEMTARLQSVIDDVDASVGYDAILLGGVEARDLPLVIPKAHDCITFFFGSRAEYAAYHDARPGTYFMTTGWCERDGFSEGLAASGTSGEGVMSKLGLDMSWEQLVETYGQDNAAYVAETLGDWTRNYTEMLYFSMGCCDEGAFIETSRALAQDKGWSFAVREGDLSLLRRLLAGGWDEDFLVVPPGGRIVARNDEQVLGVESGRDASCGSPPEPDADGEGGDSPSEA